MLTPWSDNRCFCSPSRAVFGLTKVHQTSWLQITCGAIGPKLHYRGHRAYQYSKYTLIKACRGCTICRYQVLISVSAAPPNFWPDWIKKNEWALFKSAGRCTSWTALTRAHQARSAVRLGAIRVIVSVVLLISMASGRPVHTISRFVCMGCERPGGPGEFQHLYQWRAAPSSDSRGQVARLP